MVLAQILASEELAPLVMPAWAWAATFAAGFALLALAALANREVSKRNPRNSSAGHDHH